MIFFVSLVVDGALAGAVYALFALAFVVVYKATRMINFALGEWAMVGARLVATGQGLGLGALASIGLGGAGVAAATVAFNRLVLRRLIGRSPIALIMVTIGLGAVMRGAAAVGFSGASSRMPFSFPLDPIIVHGVPIAPGKLTAALIAVGCIVAVRWFFDASRWGLALRAVADDQQVAMSVGIDIDRHFAIAWILMGLLSVVAGTLWSLVAGGGFGIVLLGLKVLPIVILGGLDSIPGTIVAAIVIGILESLGGGYLDSVLGAGFSNVAPYVLLLLVLFVRPYGLFGRPQIERV